jgi:transcriptional regulator with XRE-family HTH domain
MVRPRGHRISRPAWDDIIRLNGPLSSITEVADAAEIQRATLSGIVTGRQRASTVTARRIATALGVNPATLFPTVLAHFSEVDS